VEEEIILVYRSLVEEEQRFFSKNKYLIFSGARFKFPENIS
jgi:hypothetical protein